MKGERRENRREHKFPSLLRADVSAWRRAGVLLHSGVPSPLPLDPTDFLPRFDRAARQAGFAGEQFGEIAGHALHAYTKPAGPGTPVVYLSSGIHGDEPAPPWALLGLVEQGVFDSRAAWHLCPLLNPTGFLQRTRENFPGIDLNRDYKQPQTAEIRAHVAWLQHQPRFAASFCLHEDYEAQGFYLYELNPDGRPTLADAVLRAVQPLGSIETSAVIDGRPADAPGIIRPQSDPLLRENWPEAIYLRHHHTSLSYTFETASLRPLPERIATQVAAVRAALAALLG